MTMKTRIVETIKAAKPELALALQQVEQRPPTQREIEAIAWFLKLVTPGHQNMAVTIHIR